MNNSFDLSNAIAVSTNAQGVTPADSGNFTIEHAVPVESNNQGETPWDSFSKPSQAQSMQPEVTDKLSTDKPLNDGLKSKKGQPKDNTSERPFDKNLDYPHEDFLNATLHLTEGSVWKTLAAPFQKEPSVDMDQYLSQLEKKHPVANVVGGTAPFIASAAFVPESLLPNIYARTAAQFGLIGLTQSVGKAKFENKPLVDKALDVGAETAKQAAFSPIFAKAQTLQILDRPFATALARAGVISGGSGVLSTFFGENITEAFKQGGIYGALSLIVESPHLARSVMGRGVIAKTNTMINDLAPEDRFVKDAEGKNIEINPIDPQAPNVSEQVHNATEALAKSIPNIDKPQIIAAAIKLSDGGEVHGSSHEEAAAKIGLPHNEVDLFHGQGKAADQIYAGTQYPVAGEGKYYATNEVDAAKYGEQISKHKINVGNFLHFKDDGDLFKFARANNIDFKEPMTLSKEEVIKQAEDLKKAILAKGYKGLVVEVPENSRDGEFLKHAFGHDQVIDYQQSNSKEGFIVQEPDGTTRFISKEESTKEPFNLPTGHSSEVKGLNESKYTTPPPEPRIVNPETVKDIAGNEGKMDINMVPGVVETAEMLERSTKELQERFRPTTLGKESALTGEVLREQLGELARANDRTEAALRQAKKFFEKASKESITETYTKAERGQAQDNPQLQKIYDNLQKMLEDEAANVKALGTGKLEEVIENYLPHVWENPKKAANVLGQIFGRRTFEGPKSFLKKRTINDFAAGIEAGLTPVSWNPVDLTMLKLREMRKYVMAQKTKIALKDQGLRVFVRPGGEIPEGWKNINDNAEEVFSKNDAGELVKRGTWYTQPDAARIIDNYLSPGLSGKSYIYDLYRGAGNTLNQFQLGLSAFHLGFTSMDATISKFALGINKLSTGNYAGALKEFANAPFAPVTNIMQGRKLLESWYGKDNGELTNTIADLMASGGGRASMDKFYATGMKDSMQKALKEGKIATAAMKVPFYIVEQVARPIMEYIVPRQKLGVFMDLMKMELERNPNASHDQMRGIAQRAWDSVDNRMGQLVYDNLFWNKTVKDLGMASVRSLGWNIGTVREVGGGVKDVFGNVNDVIHGKATKMTYRTAYVMALPIVTGLYGAIYQYLHTGKGPQELKDYFFPKNGAVDNKGQEARVSLPTYMKDIYHYTTNPVQTVINKFSPVNNTVMEMLANKDFYGVQIRNVDDPALQQILSESSFMASQFVPFGFRNQGRDTRKTGGSKVEPFIGITPAPYDINMTAAEKEAYELEKGKIPVGSRTKEQAKHSTQKAKLRSDFMASKDASPLNDAVTEGTISAKEKKQIVKEAGMSNLQRMTQHLTFEEVEHIMKKATESEKPELQMILDKKRAGKKARGTWTQDEEDMYDKTFKSQE